MPDPVFAISAEDVNTAVGVFGGAVAALVTAAGLVFGFRKTVGEWLTRHRGEVQQLDKEQRETIQREKAEEREAGRRESAEDVKACWAHVRRMEAQHEAERKYLESSCREAYQRRDTAVAAERETALKAARLEEQVRNLIETAEQMRRELAELRLGRPPGTDEHRPLGDAGT